MIDDISCTFVTIKKRNSCMFLFLSKETFTLLYLPAKMVDSRTRWQQCRQGRQKGGKTFGK